MRWGRRRGTDRIKGRAEDGVLHRAHAVHAAAVGNLVYMYELMEHTNMASSRIMRDRTRGRSFVHCLRAPPKASLTDIHNVQRWAQCEPESAEQLDPQLVQDRLQSSCVSFANAIYLTSISSRKSPARSRWATAGFRPSPATHPSPVVIHLERKLLLASTPLASLLTACVCFK